MANYIAIDLGASSGRVLLARWDGERFFLSELHRFENQVITLRGHLYWDILALWQEIKQGLRRYSLQYQEPLAGIGVDTWGVDYALLDARDNLIGNLYCYRDSRTEGVIDRVFEKLPKEAIYEITGIQFMPLNTLDQLYSMVLGQDPQLEQAKTLLMVPDLLHFWLTGEKTSEFSIASTTQFLDVHRKTWATEMLDTLGIPSDILPPIVATGTVIGTLDKDLAEALQLSPKTPIIASACHDTGSAVAGVPYLDADSLYISSGTWSLMGVERETPLITNEVLEANFSNEGGYGYSVRLLKNLAGLWLLQESRRQWQREGQDYAWEELLANAAQAPAMQHLIPVNDPSLASPGDLPNRIRQLCEASRQGRPESPGEVVRCALESLALDYRLKLRQLEHFSGQRYQHIRVVGGGSQNDLLNQWTADACGLPVMAGPVEATALGNVMVQAIATGELANLSEGREAIAQSVNLVSYQPQSSAIWDDAVTRFQKLQGS